MGKARIPELIEQVKFEEARSAGFLEENYRLKNRLDIIRRLLELIIRELEGK